MKSLKNLLKKLWENRSLMLSLVFFVAAVGYVTLGHQATKESNLRKSAVTLKFEKAPEEWLKHPVDVTEFRKVLEAGTLSAVGQAANPPNLLLFTQKDGTQRSVKVPNCNAFVCSGTVLGKLEDLSLSQGFDFVRVEVDPRSTSERVLDMFAGLLTPLTSIVTMVVAMYFLVRMQTGDGGKASKLAERPTLKFSDVIGNVEAKAQLNRVRTFLQQPQAFTQIGARAPRGVLLVGPPGTGKTLLAKALAGESKCNFIAVDGSYFTSMYFGMGVMKVKQLFDLARKHAPCVLFIDEIDGIGKRSKAADQRGGDSELNRIVNRVLVEMDGFADNDGVVVVAATNHESNIDDAMRRPGRFDALVRLTLPALPDRQSLFNLYLDKVSSAPVVDVSQLARMTAGASPADIENLVNKAASSAAEAGATQVTTEHVVQSIETFRMGGEVSAIKDLLSPETRERLAYHEAAHALVGHMLQLGTVEHLTIEPRGEALGVTYISRESEDPLYKESELASRIAMMLAGREAELLIFGSVSSGAADDLKRATELAITMAGSLGFSPEFGVLSVAGVPRELLGPDLQAAVLRTARTLLESGQGVCQNLLTTHRDVLNALARALSEKEVLNGAQLQNLLPPAS